MINGDVSLDPGTSNGLLPVQVLGGVTHIHINDAVSHQARADLLAAYNFAKGLPPGTTVSGGADLGALKPGGVLPPGTYTSGSTMLVSTPLTLNGSATDVWIFKVAGTLDMAAAKNVILTGGAQARNVFWQVAGAVTIGANTHFEGIILGQTSITFGNLASINGRLLAQSAVNLNATTVTVP